MQSLIDRVVLASRHILVVFFLGLAAALALYAVAFLGKLASYGQKVLEGASDTQLLLSLLYLVDSVLVASLVAMVIISSHDSLVSPLSETVEPSRAAWVQKLNPGNLKLKLALAIVAISSIHLLQLFLELADHSDRELWWAIAIHGAFVIGAVGLGILDRMEAAGKKSYPTISEPEKK
jgi:uncharacterized protein (TIGR00645 family)